MNLRSERDAKIAKVVDNVRRLTVSCPTVDSSTGLIVQLHRRLPYGTSGMGARSADADLDIPPSAYAAAQALEDIADGWGYRDVWHIGVRAVRTMLRHACGMPRPARLPLALSMVEMRGLVASAPTALVNEAADASTLWVAHAMQALGHACEPVGATTTSPNKERA